MLYTDLWWFERGDPFSRLYVQPENHMVLHECKLSNLYISNIGAMVCISWLSVLLIRNSNIYLPKGMEFQRWRGPGDVHIVVTFSKNIEGRIQVDLISEWSWVQSIEGGKKHELFNKDLTRAMFMLWNFWRGFREMELTSTDEDVYLQLKSIVLDLYSHG